MRNDESVSELTRLMHELSLNCSEHCLILPRKFGDLEKPECLDGINDKIQKLKQAKNMLDSGRIAKAEYCAKKAAVVSVIGKH
jgi:hypothetical protein